MALVTKDGYIACPKCGKKTKTKILPGKTIMFMFPLYCPWCKKESLVNVEN